jgi:signal transduction histidine kinase
MLATARLVSDGLAESAAPEVRRVAPRLFEAIDRAVALCTRTLDFSREAAPRFVPTLFPLQSLFQEIEPAVTGGNDELAVITSLPAGLMVRADREQLYRVLVNLAQNAIEAGATHLRFSAARVADAVAIDVADDGPGLPPRALENLFRPFFGSARPGGSGLGLAIARDLMRAQGGDLVLIETTGGGTTFRLTLPAPTETAAMLSRAPG